MSRDNKDIMKQEGVKLFNRLNSKQFGVKKLYVTLREIRFSRETGEWMGVKDNGDKVVFLELGGWYLAVDNDDKAAYNVTIEKKNRSGCRICSAYMVRALLSSIAPGKNQVMCTIEKSPYEYKGKNVYKIIPPHVKQ